MDFNDRATGDAAILVVGTQVLIDLGLGGSLIDLLRPANLISVFIGALFFWVIYSGATYVVARYLFDTPGQYAIYLRITGFASPTLLVIVFVSLLVSNALLVLVVGGAWFVLIVANGLSYTVDLSIEKAAASAVGGYVLIMIVQAIFGSIWNL